MSSSDEAKAELKAMIDSEIAYFSQAIESHLKHIAYFDTFRKFKVFDIYISKMESEEKQGIAALQSAKQRYQDLETYYKSIGRL